MWELRVEVVPANIIGLDFGAEEDNPAYVREAAQEHEENGSAQSTVFRDDESESASVLKTRKSPPWDPFAPEKMWIPETIVQLGVPALVEEWHQRQRDIVADPKKFATRKGGRMKTATKAKDGGMKAGALDAFFNASKPAVRKGELVSKPQQRQPLRSRTNSSERKGPPAPMNRGAATVGEDGSPLLYTYLNRLTIGSSQPPSPHKTSDQNHSKQSPNDPCEIDARDLATTESKFPSSQATAMILPFTKRAGKSVSDSVVMSPSLPGPSMSSDTSSSMDHAMAATMTAQYPTHSSSPSLSQAVTQRKKSKQRNVQAPQLSAQADAIMPAKLPIEAFFRSRKPISSIEPHKDILKTTFRPTETPDLPPEISPVLVIQSIPSKLTLVSRDSLPGTWKAVDMSDQIVRSTRAPPRVSCVDLSGE